MKMVSSKCKVMTEIFNFLSVTAISSSSAVISRSCLQCLSAVVRRQEGGCTTPVAKATAVCKVLFWRGVHGLNLSYLNVSIGYF